MASPIKDILKNTKARLIVCEFIPFILTNHLTADPTVMDLSACSANRTTTGHFQAEVLFSLQFGIFYNQNVNTE
jgi:hypothetical protein